MLEHRLKNIKEGENFWVYGGDINKNREIIVNGFSKKYGKNAIVEQRCDRPLHKHIDSLLNSDVKVIIIHHPGELASFPNLLHFLHDKNVHVVTTSDDLESVDVRIIANSTSVPCGDSSSVLRLSNYQRERDLFFKDFTQFFHMGLPNIAKHNEITSVVFASSLLLTEKSMNIVNGRHQSIIDVFLKIKNGMIHSSKMMPLLDLHHPGLSEEVVQYLLEKHSVYFEHEASVKKDKDYMLSAMTP